MGAEKKLHIFSADDTWVATGTELQALNEILEKVDTFKYLGWIVYFYDSDWTAIVNNLQREPRKWGRLSFLFRWDGSDSRTPGRFYVVVVQSILHLRSEYWVIMAHILWVLESLYNWVVRRISVRTTWFQDGKWE